MKKIIKQDGNTVIVKLIDKGKAYIGKAKVHPEDLDLANFKTGLIVAENRAKMKRHDKMVNQRNKEIQDLMKQIAILENSRDYHKGESEMRKLFEVNYLASKEMFYKKIRKNREENRNLDDIIESIGKGLDKLLETKEN